MAHPHSSAPADNHTAQERDYLPAERQDMILSLLTRQSVVTVPDLAEMFSTTEITIRRDLAILARAGLLRRVRGGAMSITDDTRATTTSANQTSPLLSQASVSEPSLRRMTEIPVQTTPGDGQPLLDPAAIDLLDYEQTLPSAETLEQATQHPITTTSQHTREHTGTIGVMFPEPSFLWPLVIDAIYQEATKLGLRLEVRESSYERIRETEILDSFTQVPDLIGIIACPNDNEDIATASWNWLQHKQIPVVIAERDHPYDTEQYFDSVQTNHPYGVRKAVQHFRAHGHRRIGVALSKTPTSYTIEQAFNKLVNNTDLIDCPFIIDGIMPYNPEGVEEIVDHIVDSQVSAMLVHSDYLAIALASALKRRNIQVPQDISIISIDGYATPSTRPLTVLRTSHQEFAHACITLLMERIEHPQWSTRHIYLDPNLIDRGSVAQVKE